MSRKHFITLADVVRCTKPVVRPDVTDPSGTSQQWRDEMVQWRIMRDALADWCQKENSNFKRQRWLDYINGDCEPNGGPITKGKA